MRDFQRPGRSTVHAVNGMCATSHPLAAGAAIDILKAGGNAADAAVAAAAVLTVCEPQMCGLGGDCFALVKPAGGEEIVALNGSGRAPARLDAAALRARGLTAIPEGAPEAVTVPGAVDGLCRLSRDWGLLDLGQVLAPAISHAEAGVPVAPRVAFDWAREAGRLQGRARDYYLAAGEPPSIGRLFRHAGIAEVLRRIARGGPSAFYQGEVADDMVATLRALGGCHAAEDFAATASDIGVPLGVDYRGTELVEHPPNGQGAAALLLARMLSEFDVADLAPAGTERIHLTAECAKLAYDARDRFVTDAEFATRIDHMLAPGTARKLAALVARDRVLDFPDRRVEKIHKETVYVSVIDRDRMAVSLIFSIYDVFGSGLASEKFGILFHDRGTGFTLQEGHPNEAAGGKRPLHTLLPGMLRRGGRLLASFGVMGGAYQAAGHVHVLGNLVDYGMDPQAAIDCPRFFPQGGALRLEHTVDPDVRAALADLGHRIEVSKTPLGGAQMVMIDEQNGALIGASDPRKDGIALGY